MDNAAPLVLVSSPDMTDAEASLERLAQFAGIDVRPISAPPDDGSQETAAIHVAATRQSLDAFLGTPSGRAWLNRRLAVPGSSLFVTGIGTSVRDVDVLGTLLPGHIASIQRVNTQDQYTVPGSGRNEMSHLTGLTFGPVDDADRVFLLGSSASRVTPLITIGGAPCFLRADRDDTAVFLAACTDVMDIDAAVPPGLQPIDRLLRFVPFLAYLRSSFGSRCWTNERPAACIIIDDPLLRERYGFLDFQRLDSRLGHSPFSMNIAFIPWNYRRTDRRVAGRFTRADRRFSVSIHGCDHTRAEFGSADEAWLRRQARRALSRMDAHEQLTGIRHNRVMVFPQGIFSKASLKALGDEGFVAAVNSTIYPIDAAPGDVTFRDFLVPAMTRFDGAPLFMRHYPDRLERFALDLFLGRPALIVEHHGFFRNGYDAVARCVDFVNRIAPDILWTDLEEVCESTCLTRRAGDRQHVRAYGSVLRMRSAQNGRRAVRVEKHRHSEFVDAVTWNGRLVPFDVDDNTVTCDILLNGDERGVLRFQAAAPHLSIDDHAPSLSDRFKVFARRRLCEVRDNYVDRSAVLTEIARAGKSLVSRA